MPLPAPWTTDAAHGRLSDMHREAVAGESIFSIEGFLSQEECDGFIAASEGRGYEAAPITSRFGAVLRTEIRNNDRAVVDDPELAAAWFQRAQPFPPTRIGQWLLSGLNERFRFYRYDPGQSFKRHYDASFVRGPSEQSLLTLMVYLNLDFTGGTTEFYHPDDRPLASVSPRKGMALVFDHQIVHEGGPVESGRKYVLRTDVMYRRSAR
jgi:hypothetical protein